MEYNCFSLLGTKRTGVRSELSTIILFKSKNLLQNLNYWNRFDFRFNDELQSRKFYPTLFSGKFHHLLWSLPIMTVYSLLWVTRHSVGTPSVSLNFEISLVLGMVFVCVPGRHAFHYMSASVYMHIRGRVPVKQNLFHVSQCSLNDVLVW